MNSEGLPLSSQKAGRWFRRVKEETCRELESDTQRPRQRHAPLASICCGRVGGGMARRRKRGEGGGWVGSPSPNTNIWAAYNRLDVCVPSHVRT